MKLRTVELPPGEPGLDRTLVLLHGFGADEHDLLPIGRELDPRLRVVSLQAPIALDFGGRAWFNLQQTPDGLTFEPAEVAEGARLALEAVEELARQSPRPILCGFSQGAGMALSVALARPQLVPAVLVLSGVPPADRPRERGALEGLKAFVAHGTHDPLIPVEVGRSTRDLLRKLGAEVTWREYPIGHMVSPAEIADARAWLSGAIA
ncbi:MAG TPA: alpha/beta fold hydrolase [Myxococcales bacterium]|nr:alpha/beta fold hydrolase [Myxococcales bacterium]